MYHTNNSKHYPSSHSSYASSSQQSAQEFSSWGTISTDRGQAAHCIPHYGSSGYTPSSSSSRVPHTFTYTPTQESERALSPRPLPLSPPQGYMGWSASSSSTFSPSADRSDGVWHSHDTGGILTRPLLNPSLAWGNCSVSFDLGAAPNFPSIATGPAFPVYDGRIRILFRDHPTWSIEFNSRTSNGERISVFAFLKHLHGFIHADIDQDQYSIAARTEDSHEAGRLPRMASPQPSFGMTSNHGPRVVDRRATSTASGHPRGMRRYDFLGTKRVFIGLMAPQYPQDGSAWYAVLTDANTFTRTPANPSMRY